ncbi:MAG: FxLYD domain-containing protein, partial [Pseudomonadales bacterium]|nr:FxLYD domain-containing protein [Pseudomonadales bacterium]
AAKDKTRTSVRVHVETCNKSFAKTAMGGYIENTGTVDLHYVTVETIWKNKDGLVVSTDLVYVLNGDTLAPGARKTFSDSSNLPSVARCNANPVDWW